ncbi:hypothetical protein [Polyangium spumosum]|uniref:Uncharacterized protein n=1 Tax=Polyangium spumosum TaxID=889282 RepID=A0A6N7PJN5_9BACT|nr:hypothetical protein [Polyangium spumosum]MRG92027.1 hypothetical protein [Polyangium spumosum]
MHAGAPRREPSPSIPSGPRRVLGALLAALVSFGAASCLGVLDLDGYAAAPDAICDLLERCYGDAGFAKCHGHVSSQLAVATEEGKASFLERLSSGCLEDCKAARRCLDLPPICRVPRESCTTNEQCCGFSGGGAVCSRQSCCVTTGAPCAGDVDCCTGKCEGDPPTCGGTPCLVAGEPCVDDGECCTDVCLETGVCGEDTCLLDGAICTNDDDCCTGVCTEGKCTPSCRQNDEPCLADGDCCDTNAGCDEGLGICGAAGCLSVGSPCNPTSDDCCGDLFCRPDLGLCAAPEACAENGTNCNVDDECCTLHCNGTCQCANDGADCYEGFTCCSGACIDNKCGQCKQEGSACSKPSECCAGICRAGACCKNAGCNHGICQPGDALSPASCPESALEIQCIRAICANDPYCCCDTWDANCVGQVAAVCGLSCPAGP